MGIGVTACTIQHYGHVPSVPCPYVCDVVTMQSIAPTSHGRRRNGKHMSLTLQNEKHRLAATVAAQIEMNLILEEFEVRIFGTGIRPRFTRTGYDYIQLSVQRIH